MQHWTSPIMDDNSTADIEREFLVDLRELRIILEKEKEHKALVCQRLKNRVSDKIFAELDHNFKVEFQEFDIATSSTNWYICH